MLRIESIEVEKNSSRPTILWTSEKQLYRELDPFHVPGALLSTIERPHPGTSSSRPPVEPSQIVGRSELFRFSRSIQPQLANKEACPDHPHSPV